MDLQTLTYIVVGATFLLYIGIAIWARAGTTGEFYVAGKGVPPVLNGMATAADWMSAASFISMAGLIAFYGYGGAVFLMGWTGGYVLLAMLLAPYLRKFGKFTVPEFIGERYYGNSARVVAVICLIIASVTYVIGQMKGIGVAFSRFLAVDYATGLYIGMGIVFIYAVLGGMKGITYTQIAQYCVLIFAYTVRFLSVSIQTVESGLGKIKPSMDDAGRSLGLRPMGVLRKIHLPLMKGTVLTALLLVFVDVLKELPTTLILRPFNFNTLAVRAYEMAADERLADAGAPALMIVLAGIIPVILLSMAISRARAGGEIQ